MPQSKQRIRKAVFPAAGLGTRFLPATKASPKEMLPIVDKPLIQYAVEEAIEAEVEELIFIIGRTKYAIVDHFDRILELENELNQRGKSASLEIVRNIVPPKISTLFVRQAQPLGLGDAVLCARAAVGDEPFALLLPDDLLWNPSKGVLAQMVEFWQGLSGNTSVVAVQNVPEQEAQHYGIVALEQGQQNRITHIQEKPAPSLNLGNLAVVGRYILNPAIFSCLEDVERDNSGEIQLSDAIAALITFSSPVHAFPFDAQRHDCGSKQGYLRAVVDYALRDANLGSDFRAYLKGVSQQN
ncbi:MAG: UTP--glucose-1-phosphate uridylyltransferase [Candidatus Eutrophobiaceae bacterium]